MLETLSIQICASHLGFEFYPLPYALRMLLYTEGTDHFEHICAPGSVLRSILGYFALFDRNPGRSLPILPAIVPVVTVYCDLPLLVLPVAETSRLASAGCFPLPIPFP